MIHDDNGFIFPIAFIVWKDIKLYCPYDIYYEQNGLDVKICNSLHRDGRNDPKFNS